MPASRRSEGAVARARASRPPRRARRGPSRRRGARRGSTSRRSSSAADQRTSPVWPPRPVSACSIARSTETTMSPRCGRRPGGSGKRRPATDRAVRPPDVPGTPRAAAAGTTARRSGPSLPMCVGVELGELGVVGQDRARSRPGAGAPAATSSAAADRRGQRRPEAIGASDAVADGQVDPPRRRRRCARVTRPGRSLRSRRRRRRRPRARLELDDRVLRVGDARVVHPEQLADERLADQLEVAQRQVAFVELAVGRAAPR